MRTKVPDCKKIMLFLLFIGLLALSGCEDNGDLSSDTVVNEEISTGSAETENKVETKESEMAASAQSQSRPLDVPVSSRRRIFSITVWMILTYPYLWDAANPMEKIYILSMGRRENWIYMSCQ